MIAFCFFQLLQLFLLEGVQGDTIRDHCSEAARTKYSEPYKIETIKTEIKIWVGPVKEGDDTIEVIFVEDKSGWRGFFLKGEYNLKIYPENSSWNQWFGQLKSMGLFELAGGGKLPYPTCEIDDGGYWSIGYHYGVCVQYRVDGNARSYYYTLPAQCDVAKDCPEFEHACQMQKIMTFLNKSTRVMIDGRKLKINEVGYK